jgi:hypothetical protein
MTGVVAHFEFRIGCTGIGCLISGWSEPEPEFTWSIDDESVLCIPLVGVDCDIELHLTLMPLMMKPFRHVQRLGVEINGVVFGSEHLYGPTMIGYRIPVSIAGRSSNLTIRLVHPDAFSPADITESPETRRLAFAFWEAVVIRAAPEVAHVPIKVRGTKLLDALNLKHYIDNAAAATGLALDQMASAFESLGTNCEFGLFQRRCGSESLGLLRFAGMPYPSLVTGLDLGFPGIEDEAMLQCTIEGATPEWMVEHTAFHLKFHTFASPSEVSEESIIRQQSRVLPFRRDRLMDILATGEKMFVVMRPEGLTVSQVRPLLSVLRSYGPISLLYVSDTTGEPAGTVQRVEADLYCGSMDMIERVALADELVGRDNWLSDASFAAWTEICSNTYRLWKGL